MPSRHLVWATLALLAGTLPASADQPEHVLAISWQPGFCETQPRIPECIDQDRSGREHDHFSLHGLWPQPFGTFYCGVPPDTIALDSSPARWRQLPAVDLPADLRLALNQAMPGTRSALDRHEWIKHGTCYGRGPELYFRDSLRLLAQVNASPLRSLFVENIDRQLTLRAVRAAVTAHFGPGSGDRVDLVCRRERAGPRTVIVELRLHLGGPILPDTPLAELLRRGPPASATCRRGFVDPVGFD